MIGALYHTLTIMSTETPSPASQRRRQCTAGVAAAAAACLAPLVVFLAVLVLVPSLISRLLLRPHHVVPYVASGELRALAFDAAASTVTYNLSAVLRSDGLPSLYARRYTGMKASPFYAGQELGAAGVRAAAEAPWRCPWRGPACNACRPAPLARDRADGWISVTVAVRAAQDGAESDFACLTSATGVAVAMVPPPACSMAAVALTPYAASSRRHATSMHAPTMFDFGLVHS